MIVVSTSSIEKKEEEKAAVPVWKSKYVSVFKLT